MERELEDPDVERFRFADELDGRERFMELDREVDRELERELDRELELRLRNELPPPIRACAISVCDIQPTMTSVTVTRTMPNRDSFKRWVRVMLASSDG